MDFLKSHREALEACTGAGLLLVSAVCMRKAYVISSFLFRNYDNLYRSAPDFKHFIKNPGLEEHVTLQRLTCTPSPDIFKDHMEYIDREAIGSVKEFCFKQPTVSFMGEITVNDEKHDVYCDCSTFDPFVASPLLINNYDLLRKIGKKQKLTMISYGNLSYDKEKKRFNFEGHCFGTSKQQIEWVWRTLFRKNTFIFLLLGFGIGLGFRLCEENYEKVLPMEDITKQVEEAWASIKQ